MRKRNSAADDGLDETEDQLSLRDHLLALRSVVITCVIAVAVGFVAAFYFIIDPLMKWITAPIESRGIQVIYTAVSEALTTKIKVALVTGIVIASPIIIWQVWHFIKPALYPKERRSFCFFFFFALQLFLVGIVFCYASVYFLAIDFFMVSGEGLATPMLSMDKYVSFLFGFLLPFLGRVYAAGFCISHNEDRPDNASNADSQAKYVILAIFILAAILTPPDVVSQVMLGMPMIALYEVGILVSKLVKKNGADLR